MKFKLDFYDNFDESLLFWIAKFIKFKLSTLSNKELRKPEILAQVQARLSENPRDIKTLCTLAKQARNAGLTGINTYFNPLKKFYEIAKTYKFSSLSQLDEQILSEILAIITARLSDASKKNYRIAIINFFAFLDKQNITNEHTNSAHNFGIELKKWGGISGNSAVKLPEFLNEDEISQFLRGLDSFDFGKNTTRNRLVIKIIIFTGIRVGEALNLYFKDISREKDFYIIRIRGKGNKYRIVIIKAHLIEDLLNNLSTNYESDGHLFVNHRGAVLTQSSISKMVEKILLSVGIRKEKNGAHMLRHTFATMLYRQHKDLILVQEALGHASLNTSRIYTHFDSDNLKLAAQMGEKFDKISQQKRRENI